MRLYACVARERLEKCSRVMRELVAGWPNAAVIIGEPPWYQNDFEVAVWGQLWTVLDVVPKMQARNGTFWHIDNGYWLPSRGRPIGYHRICLNSMSPVFRQNAPDIRSRELEGRFVPWRKSGSHVLIAMPGAEYGAAIGMSMSHWISGIVERVRKHTDRPIRIRDRLSTLPLEHDLRDCWAVVTHSSNVGTDAVMAGIPVFCQSTCPAAPVGNGSLTNIETPVMPARDDWWRSLMSQQFSFEELRSGLAYRYLQEVRVGMG